MYIIKRDQTKEPFDYQKIETAIRAAFRETGVSYSPAVLTKVLDELFIDFEKGIEKTEVVEIEELQDIIESVLMKYYPTVAKQYITYRNNRSRIRDFVRSKEDFIKKFTNSNNVADSTIDDNSNAKSKNISSLNTEIHKEDNVEVNRGLVMRKLKELYPDFNYKQYISDLNHHIIYKHDESSFCGIAPYCASVSLYPFLTNGLKKVGGLSGAPKHLESFCGGYINLIFILSSQFAGAIATSEFFLYFDYFARKDYGPDYYKNEDIVKRIDAYFGQVVYSINQPAVSRGSQSAFVNFSYFDKPFFEGMFGHFVFPDGDKPVWESTDWLQKHFMKWFNKERTKCILTFPVESFTLLYKDDEFVDKEAYDFVCQSYEEGHSFFTYISDTVDSLSSCCRLKNKLQTREFNFTNGNIGIQTGSKSVITLNLNRIVQDFVRSSKDSSKYVFADFFKNSSKFKEYLVSILGRVYKYHTAYNELLKELFDHNLLTVYSAGFINLNKQYLTIGMNGLNEAAEYLGLRCSDNKDYKLLCNTIFSTIKEQNTLHKTSELTFNTELVPAESLAIKNYNWDRADGYWVPEHRNLYASYIYIPSSVAENVLDRIILHGNSYIGDYLDGGSAAHLNLKEHLTKGQYQKIIKFAAQNGCQYFTFNVPNCECNICGHIEKQPFDECPMCSSTSITLYDRVIGYLTPIPAWSSGRQKEQKTRDYTSSLKDS
jgi:ribonucleoside-triphosphate reductase (formate)